MMKTRIYDKKFTRIQALHSTQGPTLKKSHPPFPHAGSLRFAPSKLLYGAVLAAFVAVLVIVYRTRNASFRWDLLETTLRHADWRWVLAAILLTLLTIVGRALRWQVMLRPSARILGIWQLTSDTAIGLAAGALLGRAGEVVRPYLIATHAGVPFSSQAAAWLLERVFDLLAVMLICVYALFRVPSLRAGGYPLTLGVAVALILLLAFLDPRKRAERRILSALTFLPQQSQQRAGRVLETFAQGIQCLRDRRSLILLVSYTLLEWGIIVSGTFTMLQAFSGTSRLSLSDALILLAFGALGGVVQIPGLGGGMQAALIVALTQIYRLPIEAATGIAVALWLVGIVTTAAFGLACAFHQGLNWGKLKLLSTKQILDSDA